MGLRRGLAELRQALFAAGPEGVPLGGGVRVHRALPSTALALLLSVAVALGSRALAPAPDPSIEWYNFGFLDERWLVLGYWLCVASALFVPLLVSRSRAWWPSAVKGASEESTGAVARRIGLAAAAYWLWLGPPWNLDLLQRAMEWHEIVHLGPLQSLLVGKTPYLESGTQYGPGLQMLSLHYLEHFGVSLLSFREFWLWTHFVGGLVIVAWVARLVPALPLLAGLLVLRLFSPFHFLWASGGTYNFFFGWASCIRYAGAVHAALAVSTVLAREGNDTTPGERIFLFGSGAFWGLFVQISQENLGCGVAGVGLVAAFAALTRAASLRRLAGALLVFGTGAVVALLPLLALFAQAGELGAFMQRYFEIGAYVVRGFSSTPFQEPWLSPAGILYRAVPVAGVLVFIVAAFDTRAPRPQRFAMVGSAGAVLACFAPALLRTSEDHILAACTPLGLLVAVGTASLFASTSAAGTRVVLALALLPVLLATRPADLRHLAGDVRGRLPAYAAALETRDVVPGRVGYRRDGAAPYSVFSEMPLDEFLELGRQIHERVGTRPVVISSAIGTRGHWYFFADLYPHMPDPEPSMTILNNRMRARYLAELEYAGIPCVVSTRPVDTELRIFRAQPGERDEWLLPSSDRPFYVACMRSGPQGQGTVPAQARPEGPGAPPKKIEKKVNSGLAMWPSPSQSTSAEYSGSPLDVP